MDSVPAWPFGLLRQGAYGVIYADPAWFFETYSGGGVPQRAEKQHYDTMAIEQMARLPVHRLAAPSCALFMWCPSSFTDVAFRLANTWGFEFSSKAFTWAKLTKNAEVNHQKRLARIDDQESVDGDFMSLADDKNWFMGLGYGTRRNTEDCWLFFRGETPKRKSFGVRELIVSPIAEHSRKPHIAYERIEALYDGPYCELFARNTRQNWSSWGNETRKFDG